MMFYNKYKNVSTYIIIFLVSSAAFAIFLLSANISAHSEQVYEMTDHQIKNNTINKAYEHKDPTNNSKQRDGKVFALINWYIVTTLFCLFLRNSVFYYFFADLKFVIFC